MIGSDPCASIFSCPADFTIIPMFISVCFFLRFHWNSSKLKDHEIWGEWLWELCRFGYIWNAFFFIGALFYFVYKCPKKPYQNVSAYLGPIWPLLATAIFKWRKTRRLRLFDALFLPNQFLQWSWYQVIFYKSISPDPSHFLFP